MSLQEKSLLVCISLCGMPSSRIDKDTTAFVLRSQSAQDEAGRWTARLWPKEALEPIRAIDSAIRAYHYSKTLPWLDDGKRIIASRVFQEYTDHLRSLRLQREVEVRNFIHNYDNWMDRARDMRGTAFDYSEYPPREKAAKKFRFDVNAEPIPCSDDFRVSLAAPDMERIQADLNARLKSAEATARRDLYARMAAPVAALLDRLADPDSRITDASLNAIHAVCDAIPDLNVWDDPEINALRDRIAMQLATLRPESLKDSRSDRTRAASKATSILNAMAPWLGAEEIDAAA